MRLICLKVGSVDKYASAIVVQQHPSSGIDGILFLDESRPFVPEVRAVIKFYRGTPTFAEGVNFEDAVSGDFSDFSEGFIRRKRATIIFRGENISKFYLSMFDPAVATLRRSDGSWSSYHCEPLHTVSAH